MAKMAAATAMAQERLVTWQEMLIALSADWIVHSTAARLSPPESPKRHAKTADARMTPSR
jgi:hypothetical protein